MGTEEIAQRLSIEGRTVRKWKARFEEDPRFEALEDRPRTGRPAEVPLEIRCKLVQLACERPEEPVERGKRTRKPAKFRDV